MQELGTAFECLILKSSCNLSGALDFGMLVIVVSHPYFQLLEPGKGLVQLTREIVAGLLEIDPCALRTGYAVFAFQVGYRSTQEAPLAHEGCPPGQTTRIYRAVFDNAFSAGRIALICSARNMVIIGLTLEAANAP